jgi:GMP synthase-like glutamine amidotransferase
MGAPWGAWDEARVGKWLVPELDWVRDAIARDVPVLGICFGGQLLARALGGTVAPAARAEIGWTVIHTDSPELVPEGPWFHFHYDSWTVPPDARELARTPAASQAFVTGRNLAVQFHPELDSDMLLGWLEQGGYELVRDDGQDPEIMLAETKARDAAARQRAADLVDAYLDRVAFPAS